ncbi:MAG: glycosyl hydrolase family 18 protein [candidate division KSB1 bacterium]|nr:glycosyl hydrolase family 18 protein [candidate division KSB1 bacterium]
MAKRSFTFLLLFFFIGASCRPQTLWVIGYYPSWNRASFPASAVDFGRLTHLMHAFAWPQSDGSLAYYPQLLDPELNARAHAAGKVILLSLGGWGNSAGFSPVAADSALRRRFVDELCAFILEHQYDGVDIDWEFPASAADRANMVILVKELREKFNQLARPQKLWITMAVSAGDYYGQWFDYKRLLPYVDFFGCMTYDFHGPWTNHAGHNSPLFPSGGDIDGSVSSGVAYLKSRGLPNEKIVIGVPFYGREFNASRLYGPSTGGDITYPYSQIVKFLAAGWLYHWDSVAQVPYLTNPDATRLITFDDTASVRLKAEYALKQKLAGVMIWALGQDYLNGRQPLLGALTAPILSATVAAAPSSNRFDLTIFPNPFNHVAVLHFELPSPQPVEIRICDAAGRRLETLVHGFLPAGSHASTFNGVGFASGVYYAVLQTPSFSTVRPFTLIK